MGCAALKACRAIANQGISEVHNREFLPRNNEYLRAPPEASPSALGTRRIALAESIQLP